MTHLAKQAADPLPLPAPTGRSPAVTRMAPPVGMRPLPQPQIPATPPLAARRALPADLPPTRPQFPGMRSLPTGATPQVNTPTSGRALPPPSQVPHTTPTIPVRNSSAFISSFPRPKPPTNGPLAADDPRVLFGESGSLQIGDLSNGETGAWHQVNRTLSAGANNAGRFTRGLGGLLASAVTTPAMPLGTLPETGVPTADGMRVFGQSLQRSGAGALSDLGQSLTGLRQGPSGGMVWDPAGIGPGAENVPGSWFSRSLEDQHTEGGSPTWYRNVGRGAEFGGNLAMNVALTGGAGGMASRIPGVAAASNAAGAPLRAAAGMTPRFMQAPLLSPLKNVPILGSVGNALSRTPIVGPGLQQLGQTSTNTVLGLGAGMAAGSAAYPYAPGVIDGVSAPVSQAMPAPYTPNETAPAYGSVDGVTPTLPDGQPVQTPEQAEAFARGAQEHMQTRFSDPEQRAQAEDYTGRMLNGEPIPPDLAQANAAAVAQQTGNPFEQAWETVSQMGWPEQIALWGGLSLGAVGLLSAMSGGGLGSWLLSLLGAGAAVGGAAYGGLLGSGVQDTLKGWTGQVQEQMVEQQLPTAVADAKKQIDAQIAALPPHERWLASASPDAARARLTAEIDAAMASNPQVRYLNEAQRARVRDDLIAYGLQQLGG